MPVAKDPSTELVFNSPILGTSRKNTEPDVILSPEEKSRRIAAKKAQIEARRAQDLALLQRPIFTIPILRAKVKDDKRNDPSLKKFFATGEVDRLLQEGFMEMGRNYTDWSSIKEIHGLTDAELGLLRQAYNKYFGITTDDLILVATPMAAKKPNILLIIGVAVVGLLVVRKILN